MSELQAIMSRLQGLGNTADAALGDAAGAGSVIGSAAADAQAIGMNDYAGRLNDVAETLKQLQERLASVAQGLQQATGPVGQAAGAESLGAARTALVAASQALGGLDGDVQDASRIAGEARSAGEAQLQDADPGPFIGALDGVTTALDQLRAGVTEADGQITAVLTRMAGIGGSGN